MLRCIMRATISSRARSGTGGSTGFVFAATVWTGRARASPTPTEPDRFCLVGELRGRSSPCGVHGTRSLRDVIDNAGVVAAGLLCWSSAA